MFGYGYIFVEKKYLKVPEQNIAFMAPVKEGGWFSGPK